MGSSFEDLEVWKKSCRLSIRLYDLLKDCRDYGIKDQMLRASVSIASNIAEGSEIYIIPTGRDRHYLMPCIKTVNRKPITVNGYEMFFRITNTTF